METFVDIHCHLLPAVDDGAKHLEESLAMARMAIADGIQAIVVTPHQLGSSPLRGDVIRRHTAELQRHLRANDLPLEIHPGADVRVEPGLVRQIEQGNVVTLADRHKHVLLELPHELFLPLEQLIKELKTIGLAGILSHPERNLGLIAEVKPLYTIVEQGGLLQITAGSLLGAFGLKVQQFAEHLLSEGLVHFVATDAHGTKSRRPLLRAAFDRVAQLTDRATALDLCSHNPARVVSGLEVAGGRRSVSRGWWRSWFGPTPVNRSA
jgi:protein-tyrosine phosphatase